MKDKRPIIESTQDWKRRGRRALTFFAVLSVAGAIVSLAAGKGATSLPALFGDPELLSQIVFDIRFPRILSAIFIGQSLALSGLLLQTTFRNPLADPYILGVSSGAALGAVVKISLVPDAPAILPVFALAGGAGLVTAAYFAARGVKGDITISLLLSGVALSILAGSLLAITIMWVRPGELSLIIRWLMGTLSGAGFSEAILLCFAGIAGLGLSMFFAREIDSLQLGPTVAASIGVNVKRTQLIAVGIATGLASISVAVAGVIGFVGLIIPHMCRLITGGSTQRLIPLVSVGGAALLVWCDAVSRIALPSGELPIGAVTAVIGVPFFLFLMHRGRFLS